MFRPDSNRDRTDYSGILMPPDGYRLDRAVGTTYSLDLKHSQLWRYVLDYLKKQIVSLCKIQLVC